MGVQYDRARVEAWVASLEKAVGSSDIKTGLESSEPRNISGARNLVIYWAMLAHGIDARVSSTAKPQMKPVLVEWNALSLWERQAALYQLAPRIEKMAALAAHAMSQQARREEPL